MQTTKNWLSAYQKVGLKQPILSLQTAALVNPRRHEVLSAALANEYCVSNRHICGRPLVRNLIVGAARDVREFAFKMTRVGANATVSANTNTAESHTYG